MASTGVCADPAAVDAAPGVSAEIFVIPLEDGQHLVYAPLRQAAFVANTRTVNFLADLQTGFFDESADPDGALVALLRRLNVLDAGEEPRPITTFGGDPEPTSVTLFLTTACNLRCTYCYASAGDFPQRFMPLDVARRGIDYVICNAVKKNEASIEVNYHGGGEPTVNWKVVTGSFDYAQRKAAEANLEVYASAATNGVLSDKQIDWIIANLEGVSLSYDGLPAAHDTHRRTISGKGSSERVMHTIRRFDEAYFPYGIRVTVTHDHIPLLPDSVEFICSAFGTQHIQVEPAYQMGRWRDAPSAETAAFIDAYREAQRRAHTYGKTITFSGARVGTLTNHFCGITQDSFCLSPDGNVSACFEVFSEDNPWANLFFYGTPDEKGEGYLFELPVLNHLRTQAVQHRAFCQGCFAKWTCAGDCYHKSLTVNQDLVFSGTDRCHIIRELTQDQILENIVQAGGLVWHQPADPHADVRSAGKEMLL